MTEIICVLCVVWLNFMFVTTGQDTYNAAIVEYRPYDTWTDEGGVRILRENIQKIVHFAKEAKQKEADIIVFPEYGLTGLNLGTNSNELDSLTQVVPNPEEEIVLCDSHSDVDNHKALKTISCTAKRLRIYIVVAIAEKVEANGTGTGTDIFHNTQIVFNRNGTLIARYRKKHLFFEPNFTAGNENYTDAVFSTDFGVTFGLQICFDIMYEEPAFLNVINYNVSNVIMSTYWIDELPFLTAPQIFSGWSTGLGVNLLVSNYHIPEKGGLGSGIFSGICNKHEYVYDININSSLIVKALPKNIKSSLEVCNTSKNTTGKEGFIPGSTTDLYHFILLENMETNSSTDFNIPQKESVVSRKFSGIANNYEYVYGTNINSSLIVEAPPKNMKSSLEICNTSKKTTPMEGVIPDIRPDHNHFIIHENMENYTSKDLGPTENGWKLKEICDLHICCMANYSLANKLDNGENYQIIAYDGTVGKGGGEYLMRVQICAVVFCLNHTIESCANIDNPISMQNSFRLHIIKGNFTSDFIYPSIFITNFKLFEDFEWKTVTLSESTHAQITLKSDIDNLLSATLFARHYEEDT